MNKSPVLCAALAFFALELTALSAACPDAG